MTRDEKIAVLDREFERLEHLMMVLVHVDGTNLGQFKDCYYVLEAALEIAKSSLAEEIIGNGEA